MTSNNLAPITRSGGQVTEIPGGWRLSIPAGDEKSYRWAQLDDYRGLPRRNFPWQPPLTIRLSARASAPNLTGTWGFGLWNDPFTMSLLISGANRRLPALPNTAWYFFASPPNYLSLRNDLPAQGFLSTVFASARIPTPLLALGAPLAIMLPFRAGRRLLRRMARLLVREHAALLAHDPTEWHDYALEWTNDGTRFIVDDQLVSATRLAPRSPQGFVLWIDNQYAAFSPQGRLAFGLLPTPSEQWIEVTDLQFSGR